MSHASLRTQAIALVCLFLLTLGLIRESLKLADGKLHLWALDVGQGDAILLRTPRGKTVLVDGGPDLSVLQHLGQHLSFFRRRIDLLILTHPDKDHISGFPEIVRRYHVGHVMLTGVEHDSARYVELVDLLDQADIPLIVSDPKQDIDLGDGVILDILFPDAATMDPDMETNRSSIMLRVLYGNQAILLTGDGDAWTEAQVLATGADVQSDILKLGHHGSKTSTSTGFLLAVNPRLAIVSAGRGNSYGHPHREVIDRLEKRDIPVRSTMEEGTVELILDGTLQP